MRGILLIVGLLFSVSSFCVDIGSDIAVSRFSSQQVLNTGDRVAGFAALEAGFKLANPYVAATFDSVFPVSGAIDLQYGTLTLSKDIILQDESAIRTLGKVIGNNHEIILSPSVSSIPEVLGCISIGCGVSFLTQLSFSNIVYACGWSFESKFVAAGLRVSGNDTALKIYEFSDPVLTQKDSDLTAAIVYDLCWHPSDYLLAVALQRSSYNELLVYRVDELTGALTLLSSVELNAHAYAVDWHPTGNWLAVGQNKSTQEVAVYAVDGQGTINATPVATYNADGAVQMGAMHWKNGGNYLAIGLSSYAAKELIILEFNQSTETLTPNTTKSESYAVRSLAWSKTSPNFLAVGLYGTYGDLLKIYEFDSESSQLAVRASRSDINRYVYSLDWNPLGSCLALGRDATSGSDIRVYSFDSSSYELDLVSEFDTARKDVYAVRWSRNGLYLVKGDAAKTLTIYKGSSSSCDGDIEFTDVKLILNNDLALDDAVITCKGNSLIDGRGNSLMLSEASAIVIDSNATVCFKDITIKGLVGSNIYCIDNSGTISFDNATWVLGSNYNFNTGKITVLHNFHILGDGYNFVYGTDQQSIISSNSRLILDQNVTFSYDPSTENRDLLNLSDKTSELVLSGATLFSTATGLRLKKGKVLVKKKSFLSSDGLVEDDAISFGDGESSDNNVSLEFMRAAHLDVIRGLFVNNGV